MAWCGLCLLGVVLLACEGDATGLDDHKRIGPEGGTAIMANGSVKLFIPPGALSEEIWFTATPAYSVPASELFVTGSGWEIGPPGTSFKRPITLTIAYDPAGVPEGVGEEGLGVFKVAGSDWALAPNTWASPGDHSTSGDVTSLGRFGVNGLSVAAVEVSPDSAALAPQGSVQLQAMPKAEHGRPLTSRPVFWGTSDSTRATVTPTGLVKALSEGSVTITASSGGESAVASVSVRIPVETVEVSPASGSLNIGQLLKLSAVGKDAGGNVLPGREVTWSSSTPGVATVDQSGRVTAIGRGSASIIAAVEGRQGSATIGVHAPLAISTAVLATGVVGEAYSQTLAATGGDGTYQWSIDEAALPDGLSLNPSTGILGGAPTSEGTSFFKVWVESAGRVADKTLSIHVSPVPVASVSILPAKVSLIPLQSQQLTAVARDAYGRTIEGQPVSWATGDMGVVSVSSSGLMTARSPGSTTITATIGGHPGWASVTVTDVLSVSDSSMASGVLGQPYSHILSYRGGTGQNSWTVLAGNLPPGLSLDSETGEVSGTPSSLGLTSFIVQVTSSDGQKATRSHSIRVFEILVPSTGALEDGIAGDMYRGTLVALGGNPPYSWSLGSDTLPTGLTLNTAAGVISGIPLFEGTVSFSVEVASQDGQTAAEALSIAVHAVPAASVEVSPSSATTPVGGTQQLTATVRDASGEVLSDRTVFWTSSNTAVASVDINGLVSGVGIGSSTITATVDDVSDISTITVYETLRILTDALANGVVGTAYSQALAATGGNGTYGWTMTAGSLPPGLSLDGSTGLITGTPALAGNSMFIVQVFSGGQSVQKLLTISIG